jgi:hypothetical protein
LDGTQEHVRALRLAMLSENQIPEATATLRYERRAIGYKEGTISPWLIRALAARAMGDSWTNPTGRQAVEDKMLEFLAYYAEKHPGPLSLLDVYSLETAKVLCKRGKRTRKSLPEFCLAAILVVKQLKGDTTEHQRVLDMVKTREKTLANTERAEKRQSVPDYSEYLALARGLIDANDWSTIRLRERSLRMWALTEILVVPTREKMLQPFQTEALKHDGLVFQPMDSYKVGEQKDGATLLYNDGAVTTWEIVLGNHTEENLKKTKHSFAVRVPVKPLFPECDHAFQFLAKLLTARLAEVDRKPGSLVFGSHFKKTHGFGKNGFQSFWKETLRAPTDIGSFRSSVETHAETLYQNSAIDVAQRAGIHAICQHTAKTAYIAYCTLQGDAPQGGDDQEDSDDTLSISSDASDAKSCAGGNVQSSEDDDSTEAPAAVKIEAGPAPIATTSVGPDNDAMAQLDAVVDDLMLASPRTHRVAAALYKYKRRHGDDPPNASLLYHAIEEADDRRKRRRSN